MSFNSSKNQIDLKVIILGTSNVGKTAFVQRYLKGSFHEHDSTIGASFSLKQWGDYSIAIWDTSGEEKFSGLSAFYCRGAGVAIFAYDLTDEESFHSLRYRFKRFLRAANPDCLSIVIGTKSDLLDRYSTAYNTSSGQVKYAAASRLCVELNSPPPELYAGLHPDYPADEDDYRRHLLLPQQTTVVAPPTGPREVPFFATSALTGENVARVFEYAFTEQILRRRGRRSLRGPYHHNEDSGTRYKHHSGLDEESISLSEPRPTPSPSSSSSCC